MIALTLSPRLQPKTIFWTTRTILNQYIIFCTIPTYSDGQTVTTYLWKKDGNYFEALHGDSYDGGFLLVSDSSVVMFPSAKCILFVILDTVRITRHAMLPNS